MAEKDCFIIMPITTPEDKLSLYQNDKKHFAHVLDCLFKPAIEKANFKPIGPISKGSDVIHANIITKLEKSDLVLCDMSCLNPNVFFEFGIRTSLNKPVSLVVDDVTKKIPFDTSIINYETYSSALEAWELEESIVKLSNHIKQCYDKDNIENTLWKYFGLSSTAEIPEKKDKDSKIEYIQMQMISLNRKIDRLITKTEDEYYEEQIPEKERLEVYQFLRNFLKSTKIFKFRHRFHPYDNIVEVIYEGYIPKEKQFAAVREVRKRGYKLIFIGDKNE